MFDKKYTIRVYLDGQSVPLLEFVTTAVSVNVEHHTVNIDGIRLQFSDNQYITAELAN